MEDAHTDLAQLQNVIKRDPQAYKDDFLLQLRHYESQLALFKLKPSTSSPRFQSLVNFLTHVASCYPEEMKEFPYEIRGLLEEHYSVMDPALRKHLAQMLIILRNRNLVAPTDLLSLFFTLFRCRDKVLREMLYSHIVNDIKNLNNKHRNNKVNNALQNFMFTMLQDSSVVAARKSLDVMIELYERKIWNDAKTVNVLTTACFSKESRIVVTALKFFLGADQDNGDIDSDDEDARYAEHIKSRRHTQTSLMKNAQFHASTKSRRKRLKKAMAKAAKFKKKKSKDKDFSALQLLNDPQDFAEKLFVALKKSTDKFEIRMLYMALISRLIMVHKLFVLNLYPYLQRYIQPHQQDVTQILAWLAQACHDLIPPETLQPIIKTLANNFVSDRCSPEVMTVGINSIREICARCPLAMEEDLLGDLVQYKSYKRSKSVVVAARSLIALFREINPAMLHKRDRGKDGAMETESRAPAAYGEVKTHETVEGAELLAQYEAKHGTAEDDADAWEIASDGSDDSSGSWVDVGSDDEISIDLSDSSSSADAGAQAGDGDTEAEPAPKPKPLDQQRILTPADFARIAELKAKQKAKDKRSRGPTKQEPTIKRKVDEILQSTVEGDEVSEYAILGPQKKAKMDLEERLESVRAGREDREKFGSKLGRKEKAGGTTNRQKRRNQPWQLAKNSRALRIKKGRSFRDKQKDLQKAVENSKKPKRKR
eukprot:TRINITY_DN3270_c0_g1_i2.p1 TRINITY_DN3270_c0_g1~~TRINITY_DN3270_c0_g1_i2.p1  ORF type:complete len:710 (+),score=171.06 TRINITY_DN3270_c0_g1_i2:123-2252(+)